LPIGSPYVDVDPELGTVSFSLWAGRKGRVTVRPRKLDSRMWADLRRATKFGTCRLTWYQPVGRKGRWMISVSAEFEQKPSEPSRPLVAAVRLGMLTTCTLAYCEPGKTSAGQADSVDLPSSTWRAIRRIERERTERGEWNRKDHGLREGRGRTRKLRATQGLSDTVSRITDTAVRQVAAAVVATAVKRGATTLALPDLSRWSVADEMNRTEDLGEAGRTAHRQWYFRWHQGALRQRIEQAAQLRGLTVVQVDVADSSKTCSACGRVDQACRIERRWECPCGCKLSVEANTARVLANRAAKVVVEGSATR
jgi:transposase